MNVIPVEKKTKAHVLVRKAIRRGVLIKQPCVVCGEIKVQAHHPDYNKPLAIVWLCFLHHRKLHSNKLNRTMIEKNISIKHKVPRLIHMKKSQFTELGRQGANKRWSNYRLYLIKELSAICTKQELNFYQSLSKTSLLQGILLEKRKIKNV